MRGGWTQLVGVSYDRRIYVFRFERTEEQDDAFISRMNERPNRSHFSLLFNNCSDFVRRALGFYFPGAFHRNIFPDAGMTTPKQLAQKLERYSRSNKIWSTKVKRLRLPDLLCVRTGLRGVDRIEALAQQVAE